MKVKDVFKEARNCDKCYSGERIYVPLPDPNNAESKASVLFINERPGRIGMGDSGYVSFDNNDPSATFFKECFALTGLDRKNIFITNACICHPDFEGYRDKSPSVREMENCHYWLRKQLEVVKPRLIVSVGRKAYESMLRYQGLWHKYKTLNFLDCVGVLITECKYPVFPVAHTSRLGRVNRKEDLQRGDWIRLTQILKNLES